MSERAEIEEFEYQEKFLKRMGICFHNTALLREAFTHSSFARNCEKGTVPDYERLEFFGDAVIGALVAEYLLLRFPRKQEGELTRMRSRLINGITLGELARDLGLAKCIRVSHLQKRNILKKGNIRVLGNVFEAFVGALALDQGYDACRLFLGRVLFRRVDSSKKKNVLDWKSQLHIRVTWEEGVNPAYHIIEMPSLENNWFFHAQVVLNDNVLGTGKGASRKEAEQNAAEFALYHYSRSG